MKFPFPHLDSIISFIIVSENTQILSTRIEETTEKSLEESYKWLQKEGIYHIYYNYIKHNKVMVHFSL